jgi:hypothetical protein
MELSDDGTATFGSGQEQTVSFYIECLYDSQDDFAEIFTVQY